MLQRLWNPALLSAEQWAELAEPLRRYAPGKSVTACERDLWQEVARRPEESA